MFKVILFKAKIVLSSFKITFKIMIKPEVSAIPKTLVQRILASAKQMQNCFSGSIVNTQKLFSAEPNLCKFIKKCFQVGIELEMTVILFTQYKSNCFLFYKLWAFTRKYYVKDCLPNDIVVFLEKCLTLNTCADIRKERRQKLNKQYFKYTLVEQQPLIIWDSFLQL